MPGIGAAFAAEWRRVFAIRGAFMLLVLVRCSTASTTRSPISTKFCARSRSLLLINDLSELSRNIRANADASGAVTITASAGTLAEAQTMLDLGEAFAVVEIPPAPSAICSREPPSTFRFMPTPPTCSSSGHRERHRVAIGTLSAQIAAGGARTRGSLVKATLASVQPADILLQPIFNPVGGYASYIVPAAFVLILQQMLLVGWEC